MENLSGYTTITTPIGPWREIPSYTKKITLGPFGLKSLSTNKWCYYGEKLQHNLSTDATWLDISNDLTLSVLSALAASSNLIVVVWMTWALVCMAIQCSLVAFIERCAAQWRTKKQKKSSQSVLKLAFKHLFMTWLVHLSSLFKPVTCSLHLCTTLWSAMCCY